MPAPMQWCGACNTTRRSCAGSAAAEAAGRAARRAGKRCRQQAGRRRCWEKHQECSACGRPLVFFQEHYRLLHPSVPRTCHPHVTLLHLSLLQQFSGDWSSSLESRDLTKTSLFQNNRLEHLACGLLCQFLLQPSHENAISLSLGRSGHVLDRWLKGEVELLFF